MLCIIYFPVQQARTDIKVSPFTTIIMRYKSLPPISLMSLFCLHRRLLMNANDNYTTCTTQDIQTSILGTEIGKIPKMNNHSL